MNPLVVNPNDILVGARGGDFIADTAIHVGSWCRIRTLVTPVFTILESDNITLNGTPATPNDLHTMTPGANTPDIFGHFTRIQLTSGQIIAYTA